MLTPDKIIEIFVKVDDFCKEFDTSIKKHRLETNGYRIRNREASLLPLFLNLNKNKKKNFLIPRL